MEYYKKYRINTIKEDDEIGRVIFGRFDQYYGKKKYAEVSKLVEDRTNQIGYATYIQEIYLEKEDSKRVIK